MKILLISLNVSPFYTPLSLLYLKVFLLNDKYLKGKVEVEIKEFSIFEADDFILYEIKKHNPQIIGFSCYVWNIKKVLTLANKIKEINSNTKIILGGPQVSPVAKILLEKNKCIDIIVKGEGEITFLELIRSLSDPNRSFNRIPGSASRYKNIIVDNPDREVIPDLDSIPSPYSSNLKHIENKEACLEIQRGCIFKCHFCFYNKGFRKIRFFSIERVKKDLAFLLNQKIPSIYLMDPVFNLNMHRAKEICKFIIENNKNNISFHTEIKAEFMDKELAELFHKANVKYLEVGLQSSNVKVLRSIGRKFEKNKFINGISLLKKYDFNTEIQLILGLPGETLHSFKKSLKFALNLKPNLLEAFRLQVLSGTELCRRAGELGIIYDAEPPHEVLQTKTISFDEVIEAQKIINSMKLFRNKITIKYLRNEAKIDLLDMAELWINWLSDDRFLLNLHLQDSAILKEKLREFIKYFCDAHNIDFNFYGLLLQRELLIQENPKKAKQ